MTESKTKVIDAEAVAARVADWMDTTTSCSYSNPTQGHVIRATADGARVSIALVARDGTVLRFFADVTLDT